MSTNDRPKPPRPPPPSEPTIRTRAPSDAAIRAAGLARPASPSNPDLVSNEVKRQGQVLANHEGRIETLEGANLGAVEYSGGVGDHLADQDAVIVLLADAFGLRDKLPDRYRRSLPPPDETKKPAKAIVPKIEADSWKTKVAAYVGAAVAIAEGVWKIWTIVHGGK